MALTNGPNLGLLVDGAIGEVHYTQLMLRWRWIDALTQARAKSGTTVAQPGSPANGDLYLLTSGATGTNWAANPNKLARYNSTTPAWEFLAAKEGWEVYCEDTDSRYRFDGTNWKCVRGSGTTAARPTAVMRGCEYFDTTLGKPVWYSGAGWVDATGTAA